MNARNMGILRILLVSAILILLFYVIVPLIFGKDTMDYGFCFSVILILVGALLGGANISGDLRWKGAAYDEAVIAHSRDAANRASGNMQSIVNIGTLIGGVGALLLIAGIIIYIILG